jgi:hypothetical protein
MKSTPLDDYVEVDKREFAKPKKRKPIPRRLRAIIDKQQRGRLRMDGRLKAWAIKLESGAGDNTFSGRMDFGENSADYEGHDHCLLTDFDSLMLQVDLAVMDLQAIDKDIITQEYITMPLDRVNLWAKKWQRRKSRYYKRKSELLSYLDKKIIN